jgi:demethylmenaquinone methyltransferase/2-methoxy-6-polyprenyl-1,4-benzoquinol methylase
MDNTYFEGSSTPVSRRDAEGNTYQQRRLDDGSSHEVLKNFPSPGEMKARLARYGTDVQFTDYQYYWVATYRIMAA